MWKNTRKTNIQFYLEYLEKHSLLSAHQSGFRANDSCVNQMCPLCMIYIQPLMHTPRLNPVVFFLDISKGFDKVWHEGLIFKI